MSTHSDLYELIQLSKNKQKNRMDIKNIRESMNSHMKIRILEEGSSILTPDIVGNYVVFVLTGKYFHYRTSKAGKRNLIALCQRPEWIGIDHVLDKENANITEDLVLEKCTVLDIEKEYFIECLKSDGDLSVYIIQNLLGKMSSASTRVDVMLLNDAKTQVLIWLIEYWNFCKAQGDECVITLKNEYIAEAIGISTRTLYRVLKDLKQKNIVSIRKNNIVVNKTQIHLIKEMIVNKKF